MATLNGVKESVMKYDYVRDLSLLGLVEKDR